MIKLVKGNKEQEEDPYADDPYNRPSSQIALASQVPVDSIQVHAIPDFVFNLKKI